MDGKYDSYSSLQTPQSIETDRSISQLPGLPNPLLVGDLFREHSRPWGDLARLHVRNVWEATTNFLELLLKYLTDDDTCEKVLRYRLYPIMEEKLELTYTKLDELLDVHKDNPMTTNSNFINNSKKLRQNSVKDEFEERMKQEFSQPGRKVGMEEISRILSTIGQKANPDMDMVTAEEALDNMNTYYEVGDLSTNRTTLTKLIYSRLRSSCSRITFQPSLFRRQLFENSPIFYAPQRYSPWMQI